MPKTETIEYDGVSLLPVEVSQQRFSTKAFKSVFNKLSHLAVPMTLSYTLSIQVVLMVYELFQTSEDETDVAAISLITTLLNTIIFIGLSPLFAMSFVAGEEIGELNTMNEEALSEETLQKKREHIAGIFRDGLIISTILLPSMSAAMVFSKPLLTGVFGQEESVAQTTQDFLRPYALAVPAILSRVCAEQVMFGFGETKAPMKMALTNFGISMTIGGMLAFGWFGMDKLGKNGLLVGYIMDPYLTAIAFNLYLAKHPSFKQFSFFNLMKPLAPWISQIQAILRLGQSFLLTFSTETIFNLLTSSLAGMVGISSQAAYATTMQFSLLSFLLQAAFGQSSAQEMSRELGAKHYLNVNRLGKYSIATTLVYVAPIPIFFSCVPSTLADLLGVKDESQRQLLTSLIPLIATGCITDTIRFNLLQQLRVLKDYAAPAIVSTAGLATGVGASAILGLKTSMGIDGVATGYALGCVLSSAGLWIRWRTRIQPQRLEQQVEQSQALVDVSEAFLDRKKQRGCSSCFFKPTLGSQEGGYSNRVVDGYSISLSTN